MSYPMTDETGPTLGAVSLGLVSEPPLSPVAVGARPSVIELPVTPTRAPEQPPEQEPVHVPEPEAAWAVEDADAGPRRVVVRLLGGDHVELDEARSREEAFAVAREIVHRIAAAEADGEWPELEGRLVRPGAIVSVDVLRTEH
jgi:hypothetical protein